MGISILKLYDRFTSKNVTVSIMDLMVEKGELDHHQFLVAARLLDIEEYFSNGRCDDNSIFRWQNKTSQFAYGNKYNKTLGNEKFKNLIESYKTNGYDERSAIIVNKNYRILDGTHRLALNIYYKMDTINVCVISRSAKTINSTNWYYKIGMKTVDIKRILARYKEIKNGYKVHDFVAILQTEAASYYDSITDDMKILCKVERYEDVINDDNYIQRIIYLNFDNPLYISQRNGQNPFSQKANEIQEIINTRYKNITQSNHLFCKVSKNIAEAKQWVESFQR
jgi:hypothetical protein